MTTATATAPKAEEQDRLIRYEGEHARDYFRTEVPFLAGGVLPETPPDKVSKEGPRTAEELLAAHGLDWDPVPGSVLVRAEGIPDAPLTKADRRLAILGKPDEKGERPVLGLTTRSYRILPHREGMGIMDEIVGGGQAEYVTAGQIGHGEKVWALVRVPGWIEIATGDFVNKYLLLVTRHDGRGSMTISRTPVRFFCQNTLNTALRRAVSKVRIRHSGPVGDKIEEARKMLGLSEAFFVTFEAAGRAMAERKTRREDETRILQRLFPEDDRHSKDWAEGAREAVRFLAHEGNGQREQSGVRGTAWGLYNGLAEWVDYHRPGMGEAARESKKTEARLWGSGARLKADGFRILSEFAGFDERRFYQQNPRIAAAAGIN